MAWTIAPAPLDGAEAAAVLRAYFDDIVGRYLGRPATDEETDGALADWPTHGLAHPDGEFLIARESTGKPGGVTVLGCVGVRLLSPGTAELTRLWVRPDARGRGLGAGLLAAAEKAARSLGRVTAVRLDTRHDLVEARRLYARHGYVEIAPYHDDPYADHFFEKRLG